jgi:hypothetical protein
MQKTARVGLASNVKPGGWSHKGRRGPRGCVSGPLAKYIPNLKDLAAGGVSEGSDGGRRWLGRWFRCQQCVCGDFLEAFQGLELAVPGGTQLIVTEVAVGEKGARTEL